VAGTAFNVYLVSGMHGARGTSRRTINRDGPGLTQLLCDGASQDEAAGAQELVETHVLKFKVKKVESPKRAGSEKSKSPKSKKQCLFDFGLFDFGLSRTPRT
jgi:hypothetical protein